MGLFDRSTSMSRKLALFDLDNTLLAGDSDHAWGEFLIDKGLVDAEKHRASNNAFYQSYVEARLDIDAYVAFTMGPVVALPAAEQCQLREEYIDSRIRGLMSPASIELFNSHKTAGDFCLIITATNSFLTSPIAAAYGADLLIATDLHYEEGRATGRIKGTPCYQQGKVTRLQDWLAASALAEEEGLSLQNSIFYSDSSNDLPLLEKVSEAVAVDADEKLEQIACDRNWKRISLRT
jgi:HAD superfamily hydrolase (TIGR01490 family)